MSRRYGNGKAAKVWVVVLVAGLQLLGLVGASMAQDADKPPVTDKQMAETRCIIGLEKFLPADYYYCLASQSYGEKNYGEAQKFFHTAASWASKPAQYILGVMALNGDHQPVNRPLALAWMALAAERHTERFSQAYMTLRKHMSPQEIDASDRLLQGLRPTYADATAATRAEARYHDAAGRQHDRARSGDGMSADGGACRADRQESRRCFRGLAWSRHGRAAAAGANQEWSAAAGKKRLSLVAR
jgi:hypothetical protein